MRTYRYKGYDNKGMSNRGYIEASSAKSAREQLATSGILVADLAESASGRGRFEPSSRGVFYRELAALLRAGIPLVPALGLLLKTPELQSSFVVIAGARDLVREGRGFAVALQELATGIKPFETSAIDVAERTGTLDAVLEQLANVVESGQQTKERVQRALIYPVLILVLGVIVALVMLGVLLPRMQQMTGGALVLPALTRFMLAVRDGLFPWGLVGGLGVFLSGGYLLQRLLRQARYRSRAEALLLRCPGKRVYRYLLAGRFARTLSILARAGVPIVDGVSLAGKATGSSWCTELASAASHDIRHGQSLEVAVQAIPPLGEVLCGWIAVGEAGGDLAGMLDHAADRCDRLFDHHLTRFLTLLEPALLLLVGGFVLLVTLAVLLPIFSLTDAVLR